MQSEDFTSTGLAQLVLVRAASTQLSPVRLAHVFAETTYYQITAAARLALLVQISSPTGKRGEEAKWKITPTSLHFQTSLQKEQNFPKHMFLTRKASVSHGNFHEKIPSFLVCINGKAVV